MNDERSDIEAIRRLKARYFRTIDQQDWDGYRDVFAPDVVVDTTDDTGPGTEITGRDAYVDGLAPILAGAISTHGSRNPAAWARCGGPGGTRRTTCGSRASGGSAV